MKFTEHRDSNILTVKRYESGQVTINDQIVTDSCFLNQHTLVEHWNCHAIEELNQQPKNILTPIFEMQPEVLILGTGETQTFPTPEVFHLCAEKGIGLEVMANRVACRTYNVLTTEDREVVLALIFPPSNNG